MLTLAGETFVSRVAGSILRAHGLPELVTHTFDDYEATALALARDSTVLANIKARLVSKNATSSLFDTARFARYLEKAYATMWAFHTSGQQPRSFAVPQDR